MERARWHHVFATGASLARFSSSRAGAWRLRRARPPANRRRVAPRHCSSAVIGCQTLRAPLLCSYWRSARPDSGKRSSFAHSMRTVAAMYGRGFPSIHPASPSRGWELMDRWNTQWLGPVTVFRPSIRSTPLRHLRSHACPSWHGESSVSRQPANVSLQLTGDSMKEVVMVRSRSHRAQLTSSRSACRPQLSLGVR